MNIHNARVITSPETLQSLVVGNRTILRSLCLFLHQEVMDWRLILQIDETLPKFIKDTDEIKRTVFNATCAYNVKRRWIMQNGCYVSYVTPHMMKNFILVDYTHWISVHKNKKERQEAMRELVYALAPRSQSNKVARQKFIPQIAWTPAELTINYEARFSNDNR